MSEGGLSATPLVGLDPSVEWGLVSFFCLKLETPGLSVSGCMDGLEPRLFVGLEFGKECDKGMLKVVMEGIQWGRFCGPL